MTDSNWNELETTITPSTSHLILKSEQCVSVMFVGAPYPFDVIWMDRGYTLSTPELIAQGNRVSKRAAVNLYMPTTNSMMVFDQSTRFFEEARALQNRYPFSKSVFMIKRTGSGQNTRHAVEFARPATAREQQAAATLARHDLPRWAQETMGRNASAVTPPAPVSAPRAGRISQQDAEEIATILADLVPAAMSDFLDTFAVTAIPDLTTAQSAPAQRYALALRNEYAAAPSLGACNNIT